MARHQTPTDGQGSQQKLLERKFFDKVRLDQPDLGWGPTIRNCSAGTKGAPNNLSRCITGISGEYVSREDIACYRLYAADCIEIAQNISDTNRRLFFLRMAQAWENLADYAEKVRKGGAANARDTTPIRSDPDRT